MEKYFCDHRISNRIIHIEDKLGMFSTLILGNEKAVLFDTCSGLGNLKLHVSTLTSLPLIVINSHGHYDHVGGNYQFDEIFIHHDDMDLARQQSVPEIRSHLKMKQGEIDFEEGIEVKKGSLKPISENTKLDLGGTTVQVVHLPGHTKGSIGLLLLEEKILLSGDAATPIMCMFFPESCPMSVYLSTLEYMKKLPFKNFLTGHHAEPFPKERLNQFSHCATHIDVKKSMRFQYFFIPEYKGLLYVDGTENTEDPNFTAIIYNKDKLCEK